MKAVDCSAKHFELNFILHNIGKSLCTHLANHLHAQPLSFVFDPALGLGCLAPGEESDCYMQTLANFEYTSLREVT